MRGHQRFVVVLFQLAVNDIFRLIGVIELHRQHTETIGDQINGKVVFLQLGVLRKDRTFLRVFNMFIQREHAILLVLAGQRIHEIQ